MLKYIIPLLVLVTYTIAGEISASEVYNNKELILKKIDSVPVFKYQKNEKNDLFTFDPNYKIYDINMELRKGNKKYKNICWAEQPYTAFYSYNGNSERAFPDYFTDDGFLKDMYDIVPYMISYTVSETGLIAIDSENRLLFFSDQINEQTGRPELNRETAIQIPEQFRSSSVSNGIPHIASISIWNGSQQVPLVFIVYPDKCITYNSLTGQFYEQTEWGVGLTDEIDQVHKVQAGYAGDFKSYTQEPETYFQEYPGLLIVAAGSGGIIIYEIPHGTDAPEIRNIGQYNHDAIPGYQDSSKFNVVDFTFLNHEQFIFMADNHTGIYQIRIETNTGGSTVYTYSTIFNNPAQDFVLRAPNAKKVAHVSTYNGNLKPIQMSFMIVQDVSNHEVIKEFDYNVDLDEWFEMDEVKYNLAFEINDILMASHYAILIGAQFQIVVQHSVYRFFKQDQFADLSYKEQLQELMDKTTVIPALMGASFFNEDLYDNTYDIADNKQKYLVGITPHYTYNYLIKDFGAQIRCDMTKHSHIESGDYIFRVTYYQNFCRDTEGSITNQDNRACLYTQDIKVVIEDDDNKIPGWGIFLIVLVVILFIALSVFVAFKIYRGKKQQQTNQATIGQLQDQVQSIQNGNQKKYEALDDDI